MGPVFTHCIFRYVRLIQVENPTNLFASRQTQLLGAYRSLTSRALKNWLGQPEGAACSFQTAAGIALAEERVRYEMSQPPQGTYSAGCWFATAVKQP